MNGGSPGLPRKKSHKRLRKWLFPTGAFLGGLGTFIGALVAAGVLPGTGHSSSNGTSGVGTPPSRNPPSDTRGAQQGNGHVTYPPPIQAGDRIRFNISGIEVVSTNYDLSLGSDRAFHFSHASRFSLPQTSLHKRQTCVSGTRPINTQSMLVEAVQPALCFNGRGIVAMIIIRQPVLPPHTPGYVSVTVIVWGQS
jgi:hypothetical protein